MLVDRESTLPIERQAIGSGLAVFCDVGAVISAFVTEYREHAVLGVLVGMGERAGDAETGPAASALTRSEGGGQVKRHVHLDFSLAGIDFRAGSSRLDVLGGVADYCNGVSRDVSGIAVDCRGFV